MKFLTILMYHYVREIKNSQFPKIKGLEFKEFKNQINYLEKRYKFLDYEEFSYFTQNKKKLPKNSCILTFDDGYKDHIKYVVPELLKRKIKGFFFPSAKAVLENSILDINYIHLIISKCSNELDLINDLNFLLIKNGFTNKELKLYFKKYAISTRYDSKYVRYFKYVLQNMIDLKKKNKIIKLLFKKYVKLEESEISKSFYLSVKDLKQILNSNMYVGGHGYDHFWMNKKTVNDQKKDINKTLSFLELIGAKTNRWIMSYPYGSYNDNTIKILKGKKCLAGLTIKIGSNNLAKDNLFELKRYDTNDFPK